MRCTLKLLIVLLALGAVCVSVRRIVHLRRMAASAIRTLNLNLDSLENHND